MSLPLAAGPAQIERFPRATYRLQFNRNFTLSHARRLASYLHELGVSHIYASPLLKASPASEHGYDVCDFQELNPELGTPEDFAQLDGELRRREMGLILDVVANHMGISGPHNRWWWDLLTHGPASRYAPCFDVDWQASDPRLEGKVALPILGERYHQALVHGSIRLIEAGGTLRLQYAGQTLPVSPETLSALRCRVWESQPTEGNQGIGAVIERINGSPQALDELLRMQNYLLMFSRNGDAVLNYRRFFTITSLAGIRIEEDHVFDQAFALVKQWLDQGWVDGLRVDHPDGLRQPGQFLSRLRAMAPKAWIVVEKILEPGEPLDPRWPVDGTTGYDFLNNLNGIFIDPRGEKPLSEFYAAFTGDRLDFTAWVRAKKQMVIHDQLAPESNRLTDLLVHISARHWECRDFTRAELADAWSELATCIPVYRTYAGASDYPEVSEWDARLIHTAATAAREHRSDLPMELFDFLEDLLLLRRRAALEDDFVLRFQQLTGPIMAKAVEDTAFYCYPRFAALNEVGGDPARFGLSVSTFHKMCQHRQILWPGSMAATATHDTKWGEDVRARLALLSELPQEWIEAVSRWSKMNEPKRRQNRPDRKIEYLFYQALVGAWPLSKDRALNYIQKAAREAKEHTGWRRPVPEYEHALKSFASAVMEDSRFLTEVERFVAPLLDFGWTNSLAQTLAKITATGIPDIYQGAELWDLSLVDPDNRRPVDYALRQQLLAEAKGLSAPDAWQRRESGLPKLWLISKALAVRRSHPVFFSSVGWYEPLSVSGAKAPHVLAFRRGAGAVSVTPRLVAGMGGGWGDTRVELPEGRWQNVLTDSPVTSGSMTELVARFPVALLLRQEAAQ
jgi:(1->4)-alpha-D-glucan 1-alpha-D-glucosylmutase